MFQLFRFAHIVGVAMFFGSILGHVATTLIPGAAESAPAMLAARQAIVLANLYVTIPGLTIAVISGALMVATSKYQKGLALPLHIGLGVAVAVIAAVVLIPVAFELEAAATSVSNGTMTQAGLAQAAAREEMFGALNILLAFVAIAGGVAASLLRQRQP